MPMTRVEDSKRTEEQVDEKLYQAIEDFQGASDDMLEGVYAYAYQFYQSGQLDQGESFFRFLCLYDFYNGEYALGLGAVHQLKREYQKAIDMYALAFVLARGDYRPMFHTGQCQLALNKLPVAIECFEMVVKNASDGKLVERAKVYLEFVADNC